MGRRKPIPNLVKFPGENSCAVSSTPRRTVRGSARRLYGVPALAFPMVGGPDGRSSDDFRRSSVEGGTRGSWMRALARTTTSGARRPVRGTGRTSARCGRARESPDARTPSTALDATPRRSSLDLGWTRDHREGEVQERHIGVANFLVMVLRGVDEHGAGVLAGELHQVRDWFPPSHASMIKLVTRRRTITQPPPRTPTRLSGSGQGTPGAARAEHAPAVPHVARRVAVGAPAPVLRVDHQSRARSVATPPRSSLLLNQLRLLRRHKGEACRVPLGRLAQVRVDGWRSSCSMWLTSTPAAQPLRGCGTPEDERQVGRPREQVAVAFAGRHVIGTPSLSQRCFVADAGVDPVVPEALPPSRVSLYHLFTCSAVGLAS